MVADAVQDHIGVTHGVSHGVSHGGTQGEAPWWRMLCGVVDATGRPLNTTGATWASCDANVDGPRYPLGVANDRSFTHCCAANCVYADEKSAMNEGRQMRMRIMYEDLPTTKRLFKPFSQFCSTGHADVAAGTMKQDIYIARARGRAGAGRGALLALVNIYRSPAVLFELTKKKEL
eukprot:jgi/Botrbrau1/10379/Bobra.146_2s0017.1